VPFAPPVSVASFFTNAPRIGVNSTFPDPDRTPAGSINMPMSGAYRVYCRDIV
jgi:hypothetical protein